MRARTLLLLAGLGAVAAACSGGGGGGDDIQTGLTEEGDFQNTPETALVLIMTDSDSEIRGDCDGANDEDWISVHRAVGGAADFGGGIEFGSGSFELHALSPGTFLTLDSASGASPLTVATATTATDVVLGIVCIGTDGASWEGAVVFE